MNPMKQLLTGGLAAATISLFGIAGEVAAQDEYPSKAITIIVTHGGGSNVANARLAAPELQERLGVPVAVVSVPGSNGWNQIFRAEPDGYTLGAGDIVGEYANSLLNELPYDLKQLPVLGTFNSAVSVLGAGSHMGITTLDELAVAGQGGGTVRYASFGFSASLIQAVLLSERLDFQMAPVVFDSPRDTILPMLRGDADFGLLGVGLFIDHIKTGEIKPILTWSEEADPLLPDTPTLGSLGMEDLLPLKSHRVVVVPPGTPDEIQSLLIDTLREIFESPEMQDQLQAANLETNAIWGDDFTKVLQDSYSLIDENIEAITQQVR